MKRAWVLVAAVLASVTGLAAFGSGGPPPVPDYVTVAALRPEDQAALAAGRPGIMKGGAPSPVLYLYWRLLNGMTSGAEATTALATPCCGETQDQSYVWIQARRTVPGTSSDLYYISTERQGPNYTSTPNCFDDAFVTAAATLKDRITRYGATSPWVRAWVDGQDKVFAACSTADVTLPSLDASAPTWLRADHAYQDAALALYDGRLADAEHAFAAIEKDHASPWQPLALYLQTRVVTRAALASGAPADFARAHEAIARLNRSPAGTYGKTEAGRMGQVLEYHEHPEALLARLDRDLGRGPPPADVAIKFKDYWSLARAAPNPPEMADWIATIQAKDRTAALAHARERWRATHRNAWLVAALSLAMPEDTGSAVLARDAEKVAATDPAYLTAQYHWMRLGIGNHPTRDIQARADAMLARADLSRSDRNVFLAVRAQVAPTLADFAVYALRQPYCDDKSATCVDGNQPSGDGLLGKSRGTFVGLGGDARVLIDRLAPAERLALGRDPALPQELRLDITLTNYVRAVLLQDNATVDETARALVTLLPQVGADWQRIAATPPGPDKRFAEIFVMAKIPSLRADLADYTRPEGTEASFSGYWNDWLVPANPHAVTASFPPASAYMTDGYWNRSDAPESADTSDLPCADKCGQGQFRFHPPAFAAASIATALRDRQHFVTDLSPDADKAGATSLWDEALAYVTARPNDPRAGETLYRLIRVARWGGNHNHLGKRAFALLHARYPKSVWAQRSPYYYDD